MRKYEKPPSALARRLYDIDLDGNPPAHVELIVPLFVTTCTSTAPFLAVRMPK